MLNRYNPKSPKRRPTPIAPKAKSPKAVTGRKGWAPRRKVILCAVPVLLLSLTCSAVYLLAPEQLKGTLDASQDSLELGGSDGMGTKGYSIFVESTSQIGLEPNVTLGTAAGLSATEDAREDSGYGNGASGTAAQAGDAGLLDLDSTGQRPSIVTTEYASAGRVETSRQGLDLDDGNEGRLTVAKESVGAELETAYTGTMDATGDQGNSKDLASDALGSSNMSMLTAHKQNVTDEETTAQSLVSAEGHSEQEQERTLEASVGGKVGLTNKGTEGAGDIVGEEKPQLVLEVNGKKLEAPPRVNKEAMIEKDKPPIIQSMERATNPDMASITMHKAYTSQLEQPPKLPSKIHAGSWSSNLQVAPTLSLANSNSKTPSFDQGLDSSAKMDAKLGSDESINVAKTNRPSKKLTDYTILDVSQWIASLGLSSEAFVENAVDGDMLTSLTQDELISELGLKPLQAKKLLKRIESFDSDVSERSEVLGDAAGSALTDAAQAVIASRAEGSPGQSIRFDDVSDPGVLDGAVLSSQDSTQTANALSSEELERMMKKGFIMVDPSSQGLNNQRQRIWNLFKLGLYYNRVIVLPDVSLLAKHTHEDNDVLVPFSTYFDEDLARKKLRYQKPSRAWTKVLEFLSHFSELPQEDVSAQEIDKKKIVLVDVLPTPNTTFAEAIAKDEKKGIVPLTLDTAVDASKMLLAFTGSKSLQGCCIIRFESPDLDDYYGNTANDALRLAPQLHSIAGAIAGELSAASANGVYYGLHLRAWEFQTLEVLIEQIRKFKIKTETLLQPGATVFLATDACFRKEFSAMPCEQLLQPLVNTYNVITWQSYGNSSTIMMSTSLVDESPKYAKYDEDPTAVGCIEQLILANAETFLGTKGSSYSGYVRTERSGLGKEEGQWIFLEANKP
eukprot:scaffold2084_cov365-Prasinococcus_capsulatus_cf.AAC.2